MERSATRGRPTDGLLHLFRRFFTTWRLGEDEESDLHRGDYRATADELFRIEDLRRDRAIVERVRTGELIDVGVDELDELRPVQPEVNATSRSTGTPAGQHTQEVPDGSRWT